jgi:hypothetical protein
MDDQIGVDGELQHGSSPLLRLDQPKELEVQFVMYFKLTSRKSIIKSQKQLKRVEHSKTEHERLRKQLESASLTVVDLWKSDDGMKYHWGLTASEEALRAHADLTRYELHLQTCYGGGTAPYYANQHQLYREENGSLFSDLDRQRLVLSMIESRRTRGGAEVDINYLYRSNLLYKFFPLHDESKQVYLWNEWVKKPWRTQPVNQIREYFGEKVGFYFGFMGYCIKWLMPISVLGLAIFVIQQIDSAPLRRWSYIGSAVWSIFMPLWAMLFVEFWKRKSITRAVRWGMDTLDVAEQSRASYTGHLQVGTWWGKTWIDLRSASQKDQTLFRLNIYEAPSHRMKRIILSSWPLLLGMTLVSLGVAWIFVMASALVSSPSGKIGVSVFNGFMIVFLSIIYRVVARWLTDQENHRTDTDAEDSLIVKIFVFDFVNAFGTIFYQAFVRYNVTWTYLDFMNNGACRYYTSTTKFNCVLGEISTLLISLFLVRIFFFQVLDFVIPYVYTKLRICTTRTRLRRHKKPTESQIQAKMSPFGGTLDEYSGMIMQFGYVTLLAAACPLGPAIALFSFVVETRTDAFKMLKLVQRAQAQRARDIGTYLPIIEFISYVSIISNAALIALSDNPSAADLAWRLSLIIICQNLVVATKFIIGKLIPKVPESVQRVLAKRSFIREELIGKNSPDFGRYGFNTNEEMGPDSANESFGSFSFLHKALANKLSTLQEAFRSSSKHSSVNIGDFVDYNRDELETSSDEEDEEQDGSGSMESPDDDTNRPLLRGDGSRPGSTRYDANV